MNYEPEVWLKSYREDGFVVVPGVLDAATLRAVRAELEQVVGNLAGLPADLRGKVFLEREHVQNNPHWYTAGPTPEECGEAVRQIDDLALFGAEFAALIAHAPVLDVLEVLFGSPEFSFNYLVGRPKAPRVGNGISDGNYHRDTPAEEFTSVNTILVALCLDDMARENGATSFIRGSHLVSDEEAKQPRWREVPKERFAEGEKVFVKCRAGSAVFFNTKVLHAADHNRSARPRYTIFSEWVGPDVLPTSPERHAYQGLRPRSRVPVYMKQTEMTLARPSGARA